jgi:2-amino-4-hydroxy-6-hydroxymethyldihydropteridine diphosphokinase
MPSDSSHVRVYIGLGSNLASPLRQVRVAIAELAQLPQSRLCAISPLYRSRPLGPAGQPDYINAVAALETTLTPLELLDGLQAIEKRHGRKRGAVRWGPRTLDLDLLLYGDAVIDEPRLTVPHPEMAQRGFVLRPLADIAPLLRLPHGESPQALCDVLPERGMEGMRMVAEGTCV